MSYEVELFALAILFYLYDSTVFLYSNEAVISYAGAQRWVASTGLEGFLLIGRTVCPLNPFTPHRAAFRLHWNLHSLPTAVSDEAWSDSAVRLNILAPTTLVSGLALFLLLPLGMFTALGWKGVVAALVALYGSILFGLVRLYRHRQALRLTTKGFFAMAFECLACPPLAVNMPRRIALGANVVEPLPLAGVRLLESAEWEGLRVKCRARLDDAILEAPDSSPEAQSLAAQKARLDSLAKAS